MIESHSCSACALVVMAKPTVIKNISLNSFVSDVSSDIR